MPSGRRRTIPPPADPFDRLKPLPSPLPKSLADDPEAAARVRAILDSPSYRVASEDLDFLSSDLVRGLRLQMDYLKPEFLLRANNVARTVVVVGSSRICEPGEARRRIEALRAAGPASGENGDHARRLAIAQRILDLSRYYDTARAFGRIVAEANARAGDGQTLIMTGGGPGVMEAANRGAFDAGAKTVGLNISLPREQFPNPYVSPELCFKFHYFALRKLHFLQRAMALVAFPGGYGTLDELFEVLTLAQTRKIKPMPIVLVGERHWRKVVNFDYLVDEGVIDPEDRDLFWYAESADEIWTGIENWEREKEKRFGP
ncbi:MAG TPA: TIGR00730 family Rossman fold protein [Roseiarcus sp.]|nr:TIGR00730 family Rossman fold protein [Roseiarcus sp.]